MPPSRLENPQHEPPAHRPRIEIELVAVGLGGAIGACLRVGVVVGLAKAGWGSEVWATFAINVMGSLLLGALLSALEGTRPHPLLHPFLAVGVLGSFTTFSTFALQSAALANGPGAYPALIYTAGSIGLGLTGFLVGSALVRRTRMQAAA